MSPTPEQREHIAVVDWFNLQYPEFKDDFHHFANERKCSIQYGALLKRMGVKKGVSDFHLAVPRGAFHGLWLELKVGNGRLTKEQKEFIQRKISRGYAAQAVWGFTNAKETIVRYLNELSANSSSYEPNSGINAA